MNDPLRTTGRGRWGRAMVALAVSMLLCVACVPSGPSAGPSGTGSATPSTRPTSSPSPTPAATGLVWSDEFDGDLSQWYSDIAANQWTPQQREAITEQPENAYIDNGQLVISLREQPWVDQWGVEKDYTTARMMTNEAFLYGRLEASIMAPIGAGYWSAFWLLGVGEWPDDGEIDIVELLSDTKDAYVTAHGVTRNGESWRSGTTAQTPTGAPWGGAWHVYAVDWSPEAVVFEIDGTEVMRFTPEDVESDGTFWSFDTPAQIILSLGLGAWEGFPGGGQPDETTVFPAELRVDWVRVHGSQVSLPAHSD